MTTPDTLRKSAKRWLKALRAGDRDARARFDRAFPNGPREPALRDVQHALAREQGYPDWKGLIAAADGASTADSELRALLRAAADGNAGEVLRVLDPRPDLINVRGVLEGHSGLRPALHFGIHHEAVVRALLDRGVDPNATDSAGLTSLDTAALADEAAIADVLIAAGARVELAAAIVLDRHADVERLVREQPDLVTDNRRWARMLVHASAHSPASVVEKLLRSAMRLRGGLSIVNMEDETETAVDGVRGCTPLHAAAFAGHMKTVRLLLRAGANPRVRDKTWRRTPAGWARHAGHQAVAENLLLEAEVDIFDAISADRADVVAHILDGDPAALDRPFRAYCPHCGVQEGQSWPAPDATPLEWATAQRQEQALRVLTEYGAGRRTPPQIERARQVVAFLQSACWDHFTHGKGDHRMHDRAAQRMLTADPTLARESLYTAIVCGDIAEVRRVLAERPAAARASGGARGWTPILYLAFARFTHQPLIENALAIAGVLLDHGANPDDFYMAGDAPYSVLVGVAGEGEQDSPRQPYAEALFALLLDRGANPYDGQVLYDTHFSGDMLWWLDLVYTRTIGTLRGEGWRDPEWKMFDMGGYGTGARFILETAITHRDKRLLRWALERGANPNAEPPRDKRWRKFSLYELAIFDGLPEIASLLVRYGAAQTSPSLNDEEQFLQACLALDRERATAILRTHPEYRQSPRPMFEGARRDRPDVLALLLDLGFPLEAQDASGKRALHEAAGANAARAAQFLIDRGAEIDPRESTYGGTPMGWAAHGSRTETMNLLSGYTHAVWALCFNGYLDRLAAVIREDPSRAKGFDDEGNTLLWWLPDDDEKAAAAVDLLLAAGVDPAHRNQNGRTAADWARRRGMNAIAERLDAAANQ